MTAPRRIPTALTTFAVCRRVQDRRFLLRPDARLTNLVTWLFALLAPIVGVQLHAFTVLSSHYHVVLSVSDQRISDFFEELNARLAKAINVLRKARRGIVWAPGELSIVELKTVDAVVFQIAYAIVNPVAAGLCWSPKDWPGLNVVADDIGRRVLRGTRPDFYFRPSQWAATAALKVTLPPCLLALGREEALRRIRAEVGRQVKAARREIKKKRWRVLGPVAARNVSPFRRAKTWETFGVRNPHFATGPGRREERKAAAEELVQFRQDYREAYRRYRAGETDVVFPYGTFRMRQRHGVRVAPPPT